MYVIEIFQLNEKGFTKSEGKCKMVNFLKSFYSKSKYTGKIAY